MAGPSGGNSSFSGSNAARKHGLSRFSLARLFNLSSYTHRTTGQRCTSNFESDRRSESSSLGFGVGVSTKVSYVLDTSLNNHIHPMCLCITNIFFTE